MTRDPQESDPSLVHAFAAADHCTAIDLADHPLRDSGYFKWIFWERRQHILEREHGLDWKTPEELGSGSLKASGIILAHKECLRVCRPLADSGDPSALWALGKAYKFGHGVPIDRRIAHDLFLRAARQGHAASMNHVGVDLINGHGVTRSIPKAVMWLKQASKHGNRIAPGNIAFLYEGEMGHTADFVEAMRWHVVAAARGYQISIERLRKFHAQGYNITHTPPRS